MVSEEKETISEQEAAQYDRQIRLWGLDAQKRLHGAKVLLIGVGGLGAEVAKNIILSGVHAVTLLDHRQVSESDQTCQFLVNREDVGKNRAESSLDRAQQLNPMVQVTFDKDNVSSKGADFFSKFDVICATCCTTKTLIHINDICHRKNIMFFAGDVFGHYGFMFSDLNTHDYAEEVKKQAEEGSGEPESKKAKLADDETVTVKKRLTFKRLKSVLAKDWGTEEAKKQLKKTPKTYFIILVLLKFREIHDRNPTLADGEDILKVKEAVLKDMTISSNIVDDTFIQHSHGELSPSCAIVGGVLGQEIIKAISKKDKPINNLFVFNPFSEYGMVDCF